MTRNLPLLALQRVHCAMQLDRCLFEAGEELARARRGPGKLRVALLICRAPSAWPSKTGRARSGSRNFFRAAAEGVLHLDHWGVAEGLLNGAGRRNAAEG